MNILVKKLEATDTELFLQLINLFEVVFGMENFILPPVAHLRQLLAQKTFIALVAVHNGKVAGGITAYSMQQYYSTKDVVFVYDLAVDRFMQRKGIGRSLINALNDHCKKAGTEVVFLEADETDTHAIEFYRSTGAVEAKGYFFSYPLI